MAARLSERSAARARAARRSRDAGACPEAPLRARSARAGGTTARVGRGRRRGASHARPVQVFRSPFFDVAWPRSALRSGTAPRAAGSSRASLRQGGALCTTQAINVTCCVHGHKYYGDDRSGQRSRLMGAESDGAWCVSACCGNGRARRGAVRATHT